MAEIDKGLPNVRRSVTLPSQDELTEVTNSSTRNQYRRMKVRKLLKTKMVR